MKSFNQQITRSWSGGRNDFVTIATLVALGWGLVYAPFLLGVVLLAMTTVMIGLIKPRFLLFTALFFILVDCLQLIYYSKSDGTDFRILINPSTIFFLLALIFWGIGRLARLYHPLVHSNTLDLPLLIFGLSGWISLLWTPFIFDGISQQIACLQGLICYFAITRLIQTPGQVVSFSKFWFFAGLFVVGIFVISLFVGNIDSTPAYSIIVENRMLLRSLTLPKYQGLRDTIAGLTSHSKHLSNLLSIAIPLTVAFLCTQNRPLVRRFIQVSIILMLTLLILTASRVDLVGLGGGWLAFVYLNPTWRPKFFRYQLFMASFFILAFVISMSLLANFYENGFTEFKVRYLGGEQYLLKAGSSTDILGSGSLDVRVHRTLLALNGIWETGGLGAGSGGILPKTGQFDVGTLFLGIFFEHGFGLLSYILFFWVVANMVIEMRKSLNRCRDERYLIYLRGYVWVLVSYGIMAFLDFTLLYWLVLGMSMAAAQAAYQNAE
jgi:hypothetical protein